MKECFEIVDQVGRIADPAKEVVAFAGRLSKELASGFCEGRSCMDCVVSQVRRGISSVELTGREMVVGVVSVDLLGRLSNDGQDS